MNFEFCTELCFLINDFKSMCVFSCLLRVFGEFNVIRNGTNSKNNKHLERIYGEIYG